MPANPTSDKPQGRQVTHGLRKLADDYRKGELIDGPMAEAFRDIQATYRQRYPDEIGTPKAALIDQTVFLQLVCQCTQDYVLREGSPLRGDGTLLPVLGQHYLAYVNTLRRNLETLGLEATEKKVDLQEYIDEQKRPRNVETAPVSDAKEPGDADS